ncbi:acyl carrier protein [Nonomuraea sp. NPDC002799]
MVDPYLSDDDVFDELRRMCAQVLSVDPGSITPDLDLRVEFEADSLDMAELAMQITTRFDRDLTHLAERQVRTIADMAALIRGTAGAVR